MNNPHNSTVATAFQEVSDALLHLFLNSKMKKQVAKLKVVELLQKGGSKLKKLQEEGQKIEEKYDTVMEIIFDDDEKKTVTKPNISLGGVSFRDDGRRKVTSAIKVEGRGSIPTNYLKYLKLLAQVATAYSPRDSKPDKRNIKVLNCILSFLSKLVQTIRMIKKM